ncbi:MAG TPA: L,D-transpeptidase [Solirubrobacterales bacterium]|nr:L,D-transpeptidase [Solirubrobacterales bacterium]
MKRTALVPASLVALLLPAPALAQDVGRAVEAPSDASASGLAPEAAVSAVRPKATVKIRVRGLRNGRAPIMSRIPVTGSVEPFRRGQVVKVTYFVNGEKLLTKQARVHKGKRGRGTFVSRIRLRRGGKYAVSAKLPGTSRLKGDTTVRKDWKISYPSISTGECGRAVQGFKGALRRIGYVPGGGSCFNSRTARAMIAYRKVNGMARNSHAGKLLVKRIFSGDGRYRVKHASAGDHAEVDISRQILVIIENGDHVSETYHVSTGAPSTPTVRGHFEFQWKQPGYNNVGMYYSTYFHGGYAVHGYHSVPTYNASHGCVRVPIPDAHHIYRQLDIGEDIFVEG